MSFSPSSSPSPTISDSPSPELSPGESPAPPASDVSPLPIVSTGEAETAELEDIAATIEQAIAGVTNLLLGVQADRADFSGVAGYWSDDPLAAAASGTSSGAFSSAFATGADTSIDSAGLVSNVSNTPAPVQGDTLGDRKALAIDQSAVGLYPDPSWDTRSLDGEPMEHTRITIEGVVYDVYTDDRAYFGRLLLVPADDRPLTAAQPSSPPPGSPPQTPAAASATASVASTPPPAKDRDSIGIGDLLATVTGLFAPSAVNPYYHPQAPRDLPPGLQAMAQMNAAGAQAGLRVHGLATETGVVGVGAATTVAVGGALAAPVATESLYDLSLKAAVSFPRASNFALNTVDALSGTSVPRVALTAPRVALTAAGTGVGAGLASEAVKDAPALTPELQSAVSPSAAQAVSTEASALFRARDQAAETARRIVEQEIAEGITPIARAQARFGTWLDALAKTNIRQAVEEGQVPKTFATSPTVAISRGYMRSWIKAPDVWDTATGRAWDFMPANSASFFAHETKYLGLTVHGALDPGGTTITEILPLFHFGFP